MNLIVLRKDFFQIFKVKNLIQKYDKKIKETKKFLIFFFFLIWASNVFLNFLIHLFIYLNYIYLICINIYIKSEILVKVQVKTEIS